MPVLRTLPALHVHEDEPTMLVLPDGHDVQAVASAALNVLAGQAIDPRARPRARGRTGACQGWHRFGWRMPESIGDNVPVQTPPRL